jgi:predicted phage tail component-like protein
VGREVMNGLTFNGKHSYTDMGLTMFSKNRPILAEPKIITEDISGTDGEYDFSAVNPDNRITYKSVVDEIEFSFADKSMANVRAKAHTIAQWLACGEAQLSYDDDLNKYYLAKVTNKLDLENQMVRLRKFTANFRHGFAYATTETTVTYTNITTAVDKVIANPGTYVKPKFTITGTFTTLTLTCGGKTLTYSEAIAGATLVIDCDKMTCIKDGTINMSNKLSGSFFEFANDNNTLTIGGTGLNCTVAVNFRPQYL